MRILQVLPRFPLAFCSGLVVGVTLALLAFALVKAPREVLSARAVTSQQAAALTPSPATSPAAAATPSLETTDVLDVMIGPGSSYAILGELPRGVAIDPLSEDSTNGWLPIAFPPNSTGRGWISASLVAEEAPAQASAADSDAVTPSEVGVAAVPDAICAFSLPVLWSLGCVRQPQLLLH